MSHLAGSLLRERMQFGRQKNCAHQQNREAANVKDALHRPNSYLGGKTQIRMAGDQVGANQFTRSPEQRQPSESDHSRWSEGEDRRVFAYGQKKDFPPYRPQQIGEINEEDAMKNVTPFDIESNQQRPIKIAPRAKLKINKRDQNEKNDRIRNVFFMWHLLCGDAKSSSPKSQRRRSCREHCPT